MASIANMIDFILDDFVMKSTDKKKNKVLGPSHSNLAGMKSLLFVCYAVAAVFVIYMYDFCWRPSWTRGWVGFSFVYFIGSCVQCLGFLALCFNMKAKKSAAGISSQSLVMFAMSLSCRVFTTSIYDGYLPVDKSGDKWCQIVDAITLSSVIYALYLVHKPYVHTYQAEVDDLSIGPIIIPCVFSACFIRADLNKDPLFDVIWSLSMNFEIFQMLPQLYMMAKVGGVVETTTAHYVVNIFIACLCRFAFWLWAIPGCKELTGESGKYSLFDMNMGAYYLISAFVIETLIHLDFMYYYVRAVWQGRKSVYLPEAGETDMI